MSTITALDLRRSDVRSNVRLNPFWMTSGAITNACDDKGAILFSFPDLADYFLHEIVCEIKTAFAGGTITLDIGSGTLATDAITTAGDVTIVDADEYIVNTDIVHGTPGYYLPDAGDWFAGRAAATEALMFIQGADTTVPVIYASLASDAAITAGAGYIHIMVSRIDRQH